MRYIYFEIHRIYIPGEENKMELLTKDIKNSDELVYGNEYNRDGVKYNRTITNLGSKQIEVSNLQFIYKDAILFMDQIWVDLEKYKNTEVIGVFSVEDVSKVTFELKFKRI